MRKQQQDMEIIQKVLQGNTQAYAILVDRYQNFVFSLALRYIPNREEAEEAAQDVFVKAYRSLVDFRGQSKFSTWLYTIVNTTCISLLRKKKEQTLFIEEEKIIGIADIPSNLTETKSERKMMEAAINKLSETDAQIITLFYQHEQTLDEIGTILGMTSNHVKVRLFRARQKLKDILQQKFSTEIAHYESVRK